MPQPAPSHTIDDLKKIIRRHWGFPSFRPLQERAMRAVLDDRDSVVVLPTGGGKSLCYQAPAVLRGGTTVGFLTLPTVPHIMPLVQLQPGGHDENRIFLPSLQQTRARQG